MKSIRINLKGKVVGTLACFLLLLSGCEKSFDELEKDPNRPVSVPASLVLQGIELDMYQNIGRPFSAEMRWNQYYLSNYNYYATNEYTWTSMPDHFMTLKNVVKMEEEAKRAGGGDVNPYAALGKFFRAYFYDQMTKRVGDLPLADALKGIESTSPAYDSQKQVYVQILTWLEQANGELAQLISQGNTTLSGDFYFNGDLRKWQKTVNAFQLRMLISLSKKESDAELNVKGRFKAILTNPTKYPLMDGLADNLQFASTIFNKYPSNPDNFGFDATRQNMSAAYITPLVERNDPRVMVTCEPAGAALKAGKLPSDFTAYVGASAGEDLSDMSFNAGINNGAGFAPGTYSFQNRNRFYTNYIGQNTFLVGYPEMCFNIAEGLHRLWDNTQNADVWYARGIKASFDFYGIKEGDNTMTYSQTGGRNATDFRTFTIPFRLESYLAQSNVQYESGSSGLNKILTQKYLAFFMNSGMEAYFNWRRTGFPTFYTGVGTGNSGRIAQRWQYPLSERATNTENYQAAIKRQFNGKDDINDVLWIVQ